MPVHEDMLLPPPTAPVGVAQAFVATHWMRGEALRLLYWRGDFWAWTGTHWGKLSRDEVRAQLYEFTSNAVYRKPDGDLMPWLPNMRRVSDLIDALKAVCRVQDELQPPCWLDGRSMGLVVACRNGLLLIHGR